MNYNHKEMKELKLLLQLGKDQTAYIQRHIRPSYSETHTQEQIRDLLPREIYPQTELDTYVNEDRLTY